MKVGDKVKIIKGDYKGAIGYVSSIWGEYITVNPDVNADSRVFHKSELKVVKK